MSWDTGKLSSIRAVALDVDGTIAGTDHLVNTRTAAAIGAVMDAGLPVFLITGRSRRNVLNLARELNIRNEVAASNGAISFDPTTDIDTRTVPMTQEDLEASITLHRTLGLSYTWWTRDTIWVDSLGPMSELLTELNEAASDIRVGNVEDIVAGDVVKAMLYGTPEQLDAATPQILAALPGAARSMDRFYEFVAPEANKWAALQYLIGDDITADEVLGLGDGGNDLPWLSQIGYPISMGNAMDDVHAVALHSTEHHADDGAAIALERLVSVLTGSDHKE